MRVGTVAAWLRSHHPMSVWLLLLLLLLLRTVKARAGGAAGARAAHVLTLAVVVLRVIRRRAPLHAPIVAEQSRGCWRARDVGVRAAGAT